MNTIKQIVRYQGKIKLLSEFNASAIAEPAVSDHPLVRDTAGRVMLRGESFAGLLRQELASQFGFACRDVISPHSKEFCDCELCRLMGHSRVEASTPYQTKTHQSSRLKVQGGVFSPAGVRIRHGVAIDRQFGVAAEHKKFDAETLGEGAETPFAIEIENPQQHETAAVERFLSELSHGLISLGGKKARGLGAVTAEFQKYIFNTTNKDDVAAYLLNELPGPEPITTAPKAISDRANIEPYLKKLYADEKLMGVKLMVSFDLFFPELFLVNDPLEALFAGSDHVSVVDTAGNPMLPSSSLRGSFRSRSEQILRTLNPSAACDPARDSETEPLCSCAARIERKRKLTPDTDYPSLEEIESPDFFCLACALFGSTFYAGRIKFQSGQYAKDSRHEETIHHFLAIDRFTGGGKKHAKYDAMPLYDVAFKDCRIIIEDFSAWQLGLLSLTFKDLIQSDMRLGFGTRKGFGRAFARFSDHSRVLFSSTAGIAASSCKDLQQINEIKELLEHSVVTLRDKVNQFKGAVCGT